MRIGARVPISHISEQTFREMSQARIIAERVTRLASRVGANAVTQTLIDRLHSDSSLQRLMETDAADAADLNARLVLLHSFDGQEKVIDTIQAAGLGWEALILETGERVRGKYKGSQGVLRYNLAARGGDPSRSDEFFTLYAEYTSLKAEIDGLRSQQKVKFSGRPSEQELSEARAKGAETKRKIAELETGLDEKCFRLAMLALSLPNLVDSSVPVGLDANANRIIKQEGEPKKFAFPVLDHVTLGEKLGILDFVRGAKLAQSRFVAHRGIGAKLERALIQFMLELHTREHGYTEWWLPELANSRAMFGTGQFPNFAEQMFSCQEDDLHLVPTAEVPLTNLHAGEILDAGLLPLRYTAYTSCFRREAGAAGRDVRGMIRVHQFDKVEMVSITRPEESLNELERMTGCAEAVLDKLGLPWRRILLSTGDMGTASAKTYDLEVWLPSQGRWLEISSCSTCTDWQARRMNTRFREGKGSPQYVHTLNGSGVAVGRTLVAILENYQQEDGSVVIPRALVPLMGGLDKIVVPS